MNERLIGEVVLEVCEALTGRAWGKVFQLTRFTLAVDFRPFGGRYLLLSAEPGRARLHLIRRTVRELEKGSLPPAPFSLVLRKYLGGATLASVAQDEGERVVRFRFDSEDAAGSPLSHTLVAQLTGRTANLFLLDAGGRVADSLRPARGAGQEVGDVYAPPAKPAGTSGDDAVSQRAGRGLPTQGVPQAGYASASEALDAYYSEEERRRAFDQRAAAAAAKIRQEISRLTKLRANLERDLASHGDADYHKRVGDLLLANLSTAVRDGGRVRLTDYYAEGAPTVEIEVAEDKSLQGEAAERFARYGKAKRAAQEAARRLAEAAGDIERLLERQAELSRVVAARDDAALAEFAGGDAGGRAAEGARGKKPPGRTAAGAIPGVRRYRSSDGYEILVGRGSRDNDRLTFRVARSHDLWLHAADYPGSHVVVRARGRDVPVPHRTVIEAARLAAHFSRAGGDAKVAVNYTPRKFVSKPKGAAPGLVYLSSFRTILVEPGEASERL